MDIKLRKNQIFYKQNYYMDLIQNQYGGDDGKWVINMLMFGKDLLHYITAYLYRIKGFRTSDEVCKYFIHIFNQEPLWENDRLWRKYMPLMHIIIDLYKKNEI